LAADAGGGTDVFPGDPEIAGTRNCAVEQEGLEAALQQHFSDVSVNVVGTVVLRCSED